MATKQKIEVFSSGCPLCHEAIDLVRRREAGPSAEIIIHSMTDARGFGRATALRVRSVPAVAINGKLAACCSRSGVDIQMLRDAGLGAQLN
jgi:glutaredoxin